MRAEPDPLDGRGPVPGEGEQLLPGQRQFHRSSAGQFRCHRRDHDIGVRLALGPEAAADERRDHPHLFGRQPEQRRDLGPHDVWALGGVVQHQGVVDPVRDSGVRFHRIVVDHRGRIGLVDRDRGDGHGRVHVADRGVGGKAAAHLLGSVEVLAAGVERDVGGPLVIGHAHLRGGFTGHLRARRDDRADHLPAESDLVVLQDEQFVVVVDGQPGGVVVGEHRDHTVDPLGHGGVDLADTASDDRRLDHEAVQRIRLRMLHRVGRETAEFGRSVEAGG